MEIIKVFSNVEDPSENLYSVLLSEEELYLFSRSSDMKKYQKRKREEDYIKDLMDNERDTVSATVLGGGATGLLTAHGVKKLVESKKLNKLAKKVSKNSPKVAKTLSKGKSLAPVVSGVGAGIGAGAYLGHKMSKANARYMKEKYGDYNLDQED